MAAVAIAAAVLPAAAADMPVDTYYQPRPAVVVFRWTGVHIGLHVGGALGFNNETPVPFGVGLTGNPNPCPVTSVPGFPGCGVIAPSTASIGVGGLILGGQVGGDYQIENWVLGVEGQASWTNASGSTQCAGVGTPAAVTVVSSTCTAKLDNLGTAAVRAGYAFDRLLVYGKGGAAWTNDNYQVKMTTASNFLLFSANELRWGWMAGAGVEYAFTDSWTAKIEYNYMDLGADSLRFVEQNGTVFLDSNIRQRMNVVKIGVNYRFGPAPILVR
jgi:outer membrane immunogenic protein